MQQLSYTDAELLSEHDYAALQQEAGYRLHGGFDASGRYVSPRTRVRWPAVRAWQQALERRGWPLIDADPGLLQRPSYPNVAQQALLLRHGLGQSLWDALTVTGVVEARGGMLRDFVAPDFAPLVSEDLSVTATGHLNRGLLRAHGLDEAGDPEAGIGGHDAAWFAVRDEIFGAGAYPVPEIPESLGRPAQGRRLMPQLPEDHEQLILLLMNVLMIEVRAESFFDFCVRVMRTPGLFPRREDAAAHAADMVDRIRQDERIHVAYLRTVLSELRSFTFRSVLDGEEMAGARFMDPVWSDMVQWHGVSVYEHDREQTRAKLRSQMRALAGGEALLAEFDALGDAPSVA
ncbi:MAG TPA: hypothetical protein VFA86_00750 [Gammaproteobacteria bacterium]|nr:hypothetical protein [Gammaproteobacteria bacterium]